MGAEQERRLVSPEAKAAALAAAGYHLIDACAWSHFLAHNRVYVDTAGVLYRFQAYALDVQGESMVVIHERLPGGLVFGMTDLVRVTD